MRKQGPTSAIWELWSEPYCNVQSDRETRLVGCYCDRSMADRRSYSAKVIAVSKNTRMTRMDMPGASTEVGGGEDETEVRGAKDARRRRLGRC
jgi:hypothetical protein